MVRVVGPASEWLAGYREGLRRSVATRRRIYVKGAVGGQGPAPQRPPTPARGIPRPETTASTLLVAKLQIEAAIRSLEDHQLFLAETGQLEAYRRWRQRRTEQL